MFPPFVFHEDTGLRRCRDRCDHTRWRAAALGRCRGIQFRPDTDRRRPPRVGRQKRRRLLNVFARREPDDVKHAVARDHVSHAGGAKEHAERAPGSTGGAPGIRSTVGAPRPPPGGGCGKGARARHPPGAAPPRAPAAGSPARPGPAARPSRGTPSPGSPSR